MQKCNGSSCTCQKESNPIMVTDNIGQEIFWEDMGRQDD